MKKAIFFTTGLLAFSLMIGNVNQSTAPKTSKPKQEEPKKDTTKKKSGTRMAISNQGIPTKKSTLNNSKTASPGGTKSSQDNKKAEEKK